MQIVICTGPTVENACARSASAPTIEQTRPAFCPMCGQPFRYESGRLAIIGHGFYKRQLLGLAELPAGIIWVRRFLCRECRKTISVLPDQVHPYRWYAAIAILQALWLHLLLGETAKDVSIRLRGAASSSWRSLRRWGQQLLQSPTLWGWLGRSLGVDDSTPPIVRARRLIAQSITMPSDQIDAAQVVDAARITLAELTYCRGHQPVPLHVLAENLAQQTPSRTRLAGNTQKDGYPVRPP